MVSPDPVQQTGFPVTRKQDPDGAIPADVPVAARESNPSAMDVLILSGDSLQRIDTITGKGVYGALSKGDGTFYYTDGGRVQHYDPLAKQSSVVFSDTYEDRVISTISYADGTLAVSVTEESTNPGLALHEVFIIDESLRTVKSTLGPVPPEIYSLPHYVGANGEYSMVSMRGGDSCGGWESYYVFTDTKQPKKLVEGGLGCSDKQRIVLYDAPTHGLITAQVTMREQTEGPPIAQLQDLTRLQANGGDPEPLMDLTTFDTPVEDYAVDPQGRTIALLDADMVHLYSLEQRKIIGTADRPRGQFLSLHLQNGILIAIRISDSEIDVINLMNGKSRTVSYEDVYKKPQTDLSFAGLLPDGRVVFVSPRYMTP
jgi:hypothetical protein